jgi:hypothetical protein
VGYAGYWDIHVFIKGNGGVPHHGKAVAGSAGRFRPEIIASGLAIYMFHTAKRVA